MAKERTSALSHPEAEGIPVLDLKLAFSCKAYKQQSAKELHEILRSIGVLALKNHGMDLNAKNEIETAGTKFFHLPQQIKGKYAAPLETFEGYYKANRGYHCRCRGKTNTSPDTSEGYVRESYQAPVRNDEDQSMWSREIEELEPAVQAWIQECRHVGMKMNRLLALSLDLHEEYFNRELFLNGRGLGWEDLRFQYYPEELYTTSEKGTTSMGAHTDIGWLTLLAFNGVPGLQICTVEKEWINTNNVTKNMVIVIPGDFVHILTNGLYHSPLHRVVNPTGQERISFPMFFNPDLTLIGKPIPELMKDDEEPKFVAKTFNEHIKDHRKDYRKPRRHEVPSSLE
eukprot:Clim_evm10s98 gene=Clim_evmTU10s98